jgi:hypothetical protein
METLLFLVLIGAVIWLIQRHNHVVDRLAELERQWQRVSARLSSVEVLQGRDEMTRPGPAPETGAGDRPQAAGAPDQVSLKAEPVVREEVVPKIGVVVSPERGLENEIEVRRGVGSTGSGVVSDGRPETRAPRKVTPPSLPKSAEPVEAAKQESTLRPLLQKLNLLPPSGENAEAALASWWLTRIGLVVLIIAAVFFGVRIAEQVNPIVRLLIVGGVAAGMTWLGTWLERRVAQFGRLVSAGGLALGYFTAFAAYGIEAMKVVENPALGFGLQALAAAGIVVWSMWKNDERVATMGVLLGYVACWFSHAHELDHFGAIGLLVLAGGAGLVQITRRWLVPMGVATAGSWIGFLILASQDWPNQDPAPSLAFILTCLLGLMALLEAISFVAEERFRDGPQAEARKRHWVAIANTSLGTLVTWLAVRLAFSERIEVAQLDVAYLALAIMIGAFSAVRFVRKHSVNLTQAYFLKASALLALFIVEAFDGPTRWLSLSIQTLVLLWAYRQSGLKWIEVGYAVLFACSLGAIGHDVWMARGETEWSLFGMTNFIGTLSLVLLAVSMALHALWNPGRSLAGRRQTVDAVLVEAGAAAGLRFLGALGLGLTACVLAYPGAFGAPSPEGVLFLSSLALLIAAPAIILRQVPPVVSGLTALGGATLAYAVSPDASGWGAGWWLAALGFGMAEVALRLWKNDWVLGHGARMILHGIGASALAVMLVRMTPGTPTLAVAGLIGFAVAGAWALASQSRSFPEHHESETSEEVMAWQWVLGGGIGLLALFVGVKTLDGLHFGPSWMAVAGGVLLAAAWFTRNAVPALAGGIPLVAAVVLHPTRFGGSSSVPDHLIAALLIVVVCAVTAAVLWRKVDARIFRAAIGFDATLHILALLVLHWFFRSHTSAAVTLAADAMTALALVLIYRRFPLPTLHLVSVVPMILGGGRIYTRVFSNTPEGADLWWWVAAVLIFAWLLTNAFALRQAGGQAVASKVQQDTVRIHEGVAAVLLTMIGFHAAPVPWEMTALAFFGAALAALGRWMNLTATHWLSILPLGLAVVKAAPRTPGWGNLPESTLAALILTVVLLVLHGVIVCWRVRDLRNFAWAHGLLALLILLPAFTSNSYGVESKATVCWGLTAIGLFLAGLTAGLRPFRLAGLLGLVCAILRMFIVDIDDGLQRIFAFAGIAVVLLVIGYLYNRFRHLIERADES